MPTALNWTVGFSQTLQSAPETRFPATVPGAVQLDYARAHNWPAYWQGDNFKEYAWMEDVYWHYQTRIESSHLPPKGQELHLVCKGIDYRFIIKLDGKVLLEQEGMFSSVDLSLSATPGSLLEIILFPAPKIPGKPADRTQAAHSCKPAVSYGWDWHPRLIPLGIWDDCYLESRPTLHLCDAELLYDLTEDLKHASLNLQLTTSLATTAHARWQLQNPAGKTVLELSLPITATSTQHRASLDNPELWWPHEQGPQNLYTSIIELFDPQNNLLSTRTFRTGFRKIRLIMNPAQWAFPDDFPKSRTHPPTTLEINNRPIFAKGSNWVNPEIFPGTITAETYRPLIEMAQQAHFNLFRVWGGGIVNKESFFDLCDQLGIMVWQEFPLACNYYPDDPAYLKILDQESRAIIQRLRRHPSLALWCGGNELFNAWSGMTDQSLPLRLLNANCLALDPQTPYIPTSPLDGMAHGCYLFRYHDGREVFQVMPAAKYTAYTEFGVPGPSSESTLKSFIPAADLFPPKPGTAWETHHAFGAWLGSTWLELPLIEEYFGPSPDLATLVARGQWMQAEGYKCIYEESRRQKPTCAMALNWCYNEPWPAAANNSLITWPAEAKPAYHAVASSCRPFLASARIAKFRWVQNELFAPELWLLNDSPNSVPGSTVEAILLIAGQEIPLLEWNFPSLAPNTNLAGPTLRYTLPYFNADRLTLILRVKGHPEWSSQYILPYRPIAAPKIEPVTRTMNT